MIAALTTTPVYAPPLAPLPPLCPLEAVRRHRILFKSASIGLITSICNLFDYNDCLRDYIIPCRRRFCLSQTKRSKPLENNMNCLCVNCSCAFQNGTIDNTAVKTGVSGNASAGGSTGGIDYLMISYFVFGLVGVVGNCFACAIIIGHRPLRMRLANYYVISQCALDLIVSLLLLTNMTTFTDFKISLDAGGMINCYLWKSRALLLGFMASSVFNIVALTIERYFEVIYPIKHKIYFSRSIVIVSISASWVMGIVFKMCHIYALLIVTADGFCLPGGNIPARATITSVTNFLGEYFINICIIAFCYIQMGRKLRISVAPRSTSTAAESATSRARKNILKTLLNVVVCLALSGIFKQVLVLLNGLGVYTVDFGGTMYKVSLSLQFSNCCVNPFIYMFQYKEFQRGVVVLFRLRQTKRGVDAAPTRSFSQGTSLHI